MTSPTPRFTVRPLPLGPSFAALLFGATLASAAAPTSASDAEPAVWTQWRGPTRTSFVADVGPAWPDSLDDSTWTQRWRVDLGPGYSGPIVAADRVFVTETVDKKTEVVHALNRADGTKLWRADWEGSLSVPFFAKANGDWIRATPTLADGALYVGGIRDLLVALNSADGKEKWRVDFVDRYKTPPPAFGFVCSPLVDAGAIYTQAGGALVKLDAATGESKWRVLDDGGGMNGSAFSSPVVATLSGVRQLVVQTRTELCGVDLETGEILWKQEVPAFRGMNILTPLVVGDRIFTSTYGGKSFLYRIDKSAAGFAVSTVWQNKLQGYMSSPVVVGEFVYLHLRNQRFACIGLADGKERWTTKPFGKYWSMVARGDRLLALDETGVLRLIRATPEKYDPLDERKVAESESWAHLAVAGDELFLRDLNGATAVRWSAPPK
ncbi:MAG: PQQ-binding-like beta-propeller repeat protein [Planctomycetia bacterium]